MVGNDESVSQWQEPAKRPACSRCRQQKLRCFRTGPSSEPCLRCQRAKVPCVTGPMGRVGRPARNSTRLEQHTHDAQSVVHMDLASFESIMSRAEQLQDQAGTWQRVFDGHEIAPLLPEWVGASSSRSEVPSSAFHRPAGEVNYDTSAVSRASGGIASEGNHRNKEIASHRYPAAPVENSAFLHSEVHSQTRSRSTEKSASSSTDAGAGGRYPGVCHHASFMLEDAPNRRHGGLATGTDDDPVQESSSGSGDGSPASCMQRLLALQSRIWLQRESLDIRSCSHWESGRCRSGKLDQVLQDCSDLTAVLTEIDNSTETPSHSDSTLSTWLGTTPTDPDGVWSDYHLNDDSRFGSVSRHVNNTSATAFNPLATGSSQERFETIQTRSEATGEPHTSSLQPSTDSHKLAHVDVVVILTATSCYIQLMRILHCALSRMHDALVAGDEAALNSLWSAANSNVILPEVRLKVTLQVKIAIEIVLHVLDRLEERMGLSVLNARTSNAKTQEVREFPSSDLFLSIVSAAVDAEDACRISRERAAGTATREPSGGGRQEAHSVVRAQIQKISDYISRKPLF